ncbi:hybrid sensor histidine kinase/response regulator transcription factor [Niabella ginsengisoli]|uniref:histidine kinase n=1 Tax=Niabella ginsengisoli TaxID=522298 RepID=A0ABS9SIN9_9BACT|nr:response regulator [Niabella ginsengisoli]MCH5598232.1 response regulator [Niabella ginsengisoli]
MTEFLEKGFDASYKEKLWQMYRNAKRILTLTNQLLDFRKMETGHMKIKAAQVDITRVINEIFLVFKNKAASQHIQYSIHIDEPALIYCDKDKMEIVFTNLLSNAFKYTADGGSITIKIVTVGNSKRDALYYNSNDNNKKLAENYLKIIVTDNGAGIPPAEVYKVFNSYYQASQAKSLNTTGTGLGLSIAKGIVDMHQGFITVDSDINKGSTFTVALPFGKAHLKESDITTSHTNPDDVTNYDDIESEFDTLEIPQPPLYISEQDNNTSYHETPWLITDETDLALPTIEVNDKGDITPLYQLLIVEDNLELLQYLQKTLAVYYKIVTAKNGKEGLLKARQYLPDIILSDVMMPGMDGLEMCQLLKSDPELNYIPVILLTARTASVYEIEGIETGADDYITKPFNFRLLKAKLNNFLTQRENVRQYFKKLITLQPSDTQINTADEQFLDKLIKLVESSLTDDNFSVKKLSQGMAMSQSTLYKRIKDLTGNSVVDFIKSVRIRRAAQLLIHQKMKVNEVALEVGITDQKYFREQFRKYFGQTPSEYLKNNKSDTPR